MSIARLKQMVENCYWGGQEWWSSYRKVPAIASVAGNVVDLSMAPGNPRPNYYVGDALTAKVLNGNYGMWHGGAVTPATKHLRKFSVVATNAGVMPAVFTLCDYLMFYPLIDMDSTDEQFLVNYGATETTITSPSAAVLPRYTAGLGVRAFLVASNPYIGGSQFFINYTNSDGVAGRISRIMTSNTSSYIGTLVHSGPLANMHGTFINLAPGDKGIRSVQSITFLNPNGGLAVLVLVVPLANVYGRELTQFNEWDFFTMKAGMPRIYDGAYLNMIAAVNGSVAGQYITGYLEVIWN